MAATHDDSPETEKDARQVVAVAGVREGLIQSSSNYAGSYAYMVGNCAPARRMNVARRFVDALRPIKL
jgi:hypothetical protein